MPARFVITTLVTKRAATDDGAHRNTRLPVYIHDSTRDFACRRYDLGSVLELIPPGS